MISFELSTHIYRPLSQVFVFVTTPENDFLWQYQTLASARVSGGEVGLGTLFRAVGHFLGQRMERVFEVTSFEQNKIYGYQSLSGPVTSQTLYHFEIMGARTVLRMAVQLDSANSLSPVGNMAEKRVKKQYRQDFDLLQNVLETTPLQRSSYLPT
jgi:hypothetical protein